MSLEEFEKSELEWPVLESIFTRHSNMLKELETTGGYVSARLQRVSQVHSLKLRVKDPERLVAKLIRKRLDDPEFAVDCDTYEECVPDLIGIRALHLFKDEWLPIHEFVVETWDLDEDPIAYVREGDSEGIYDAFQTAKCKVIRHDFGYRSIHYVIRTRPDKRLHLVELQVRTVFEEGWSEIDHSVRYPRLSSDPNLVFSLAIFNRLAGSADEMAAFIKTLSSFLEEQGGKLAERDRLIAEKENELKQTLSKLKISSVEKKKLEQQLMALRESSLLEISPSWRMNVNDFLPTSMLMEGLGPTGPVVNYADPTVLRTKTCTTCGKMYIDDDTSAKISDQCPDCRGKFFSPS